MSLFSALTSTANSLAAFEQALSVTQNNVENASTPGYVKQTATFSSLPFSGDEAGGVVAGEMLSSRNEYAENNVRTANSQFGYSEQQVDSLTTLQNQFDISGKSGIPAALSSFYTAASSWSTSPNDPTLQQNVLTQAQTVATAFNTAQSNLAQTTSQTDTQIDGLVSQINSYSQQISQYNAHLSTGRQADPSLDASIHSALENLSELTNSTVLKQKDGSYEVLLDGGQSALVAGTNAYPLSVAQGVVHDSTGRDATAQITGGKLGAALNFRNNLLPSIAGKGNQPGSLNLLAKGFADRVNTLLTSGNTTAGVEGTALFAYDVPNIAGSLRISGGITTLATTQPAAVTGAPVMTAINTTTNNVLNLKIDGTTYGVLLNASASASLTGVAADITTKLAALGSNATARVNSNGSLQIVSGTNSSTASVQVLAGSANGSLGLTLGAGTSYVSNGVTVSLASLANPKTSADGMSGQSFIAYFGSIASSVGAQLSQATSNKTTGQDLLTQAQTLRHNASGIDLNEEATNVLMYQRSFQAASKLMTVIDEMVQTVVNLIQPS